jgi:hypothetical protein
MPHVFLSYVREDSAMVDRLADYLRRSGVEVWLDRNNIKPGQRWDLAIREAVRSGDFFVACFSENSVGRQRSGMNQEIVFALDELCCRPLNRTWFIPVLFSPCEIPEHSLGGTASLRSIQYVNLYENWNAGVRSILEAIAPGRLNNPRAELENAKILRLVRMGSDFTDNDDDTIGEITGFGRAAIPIIIETMKNPPAHFIRNDFDLLVRCLGRIGRADADVVSTIARYARVNRGFSWVAVTALGSIASSTAIPFLTEYFSEFRNTLEGSSILLALGKIGNAVSLPIILEAFLGWRGEKKDILLFANHEGEDLSLLFPYRELDALRYFGPASLPQLISALSSSDPLRRIRAACAIACLDQARTFEMEAIMVDYLSGSREERNEALFALRCFCEVSSSACLQEVIRASYAPEADTRLLAVKVLAGNCGQRPEAQQALRDRKEDPEHSVREAEWRSRSSIWEEVYYFWIG